MAAFHFKTELNNNRSVMDELPRGAGGFGVSQEVAARGKKKKKKKSPQKKRAEAQICRGSVAPL